MTDVLGSVLPDLHLDLRVAYDGSASLVAHADSHARDLPLYVQAPVFAPPTPDQLLQQLRHAYLSWDICDVLRDVSTCGHVIGCRFLGAVPPGSAPECSLPTTLVEAVMPDPPPPWAPERAVKPHQQAQHEQQQGADGRNALAAEAQQAEGVVGWRQLTMSLKDQAQEDAAGLRARLAAREGASSSSWKGFSVSTPFTPGGASASTAAMPASSSAVQEAESGAWLQQLLALQGGRMHEVPRVKAPGLPHGLFGAWEWEEEPASIQQASAPAAAPSASVGSAAASPGAGTAAAGGGAAPGGNGGTASLFQNLWMLDEEAEEEVVEQSPVQAPAAAAPAASALSRAAQTGPAQDRQPGGDVAPEAAGGAIDSLLDATAGEVEAAAARQLQRQESTAKAAAAASASTALSRMPLAGQGGGASAGSAAGQHEWAVRGNVPDLDARWGELKPNLALHYPFELDVFQKEAILHMEASRSVFVAAHTSAGKTVVAEYAFALAMRHYTRAVYTSPIKTISNQKFRDFSGKFEVGLLTGDVQIKTSAPCLIMTTEILRSMLYKGADVIRDIEWVVFDEVHYVNDADRGVVWEEVIIMLPPHVNLVLLSATVPNVMDFADWIGRTKRKVIYVTGTTRRPVPLEHALYFGGEMYTISSREVYVPEGMRQATLAWKRKNEVPETKKDDKAARPTGRGAPGPGPNQGGRGGGQARGGRAGGGGGGYGPRPSGADAARRALQGGRGGGANMQPGERGQMLELIATLGKRQLLPVAFFCFSKKRCDSSVDGAGGVDLTTSAEKHTIHVFVEKCLTRLREEDRKLPQIARLRDLMRRGLAVHHAGLLPIMKEVVEMLFCQGYIKVLFCTETFAMGVNAPTRTVVFHSLRKHDGKNFRYLLPSEYTQMAGRAGRRGLDPVGTVLVACWEDLPPEGELRTMLTGRGVSLESRFRLTYSMILNLLRVEDLKVEDMLKRSFAEWRAQRSQPKALQQLEEVERHLSRVSSCPWPSCVLGCSRQEVEGYHAASARIEELSAMLQERLMAYKSVQQALVPGRAVLYLNPVNGLTELALVLGDGEAKGSGLTLSSKPAAAAAETPASPPDRKLYLLVLHRPGPVDHRHARVAEEGKSSDTPAAAAAAAAGRASALEDQFQGMVLRSPAQGGRGLVSGRSRGPGPLPRYGQLAGVDYVVVEAGSREVVGVCKSKLKVDAEDVLSGDWEGDACRRAMVAALRGLAKLQEEAAGEPPLLDWRADLKVTDIDTSQALAERGALMSRRCALRPHRCPSLSEQYGLVRAQYALTRTRESLRHQLSDASLQQLPEFHQRVGVLQQLGYLDEDRTVTLKGRVACEINSTQDELVASEMVFAGLLSDLSPEEAVALISALVFQEKSEVEPELPPALAAARGDLEALVKAATETQAEHGLQIDPQEYVRDVMHCGLMQVVYEWARGTPFDQICTLTDVMEGSIVRAIVRLDQACRELMDAARVMGNTSLFQKMQSASAAIKRDVIFAASLYVA